MLDEKVDIALKEKMSKIRIVRYVLITIFTFGLIFFLGWLFDDKYFLGSATLCFGVIQVVFMMKGTWVAEVLALFECLVGIAIYVFNGLWGTVIFSFIIYIPLNVYGIISWKNNQVDGVIKINKLNLKKFMIIIGSVLAGAALLNWFLSMIPSQRMSMLDSLVNVLNIMGIVMLNLRYKEGWFFWMTCNIIESITWVTFIILGTGSNAIMMLLICITYLILDVFAYKSFVKLNTKQTAMMITKSK